MSLENIGQTALAMLPGLVGQSSGTPVSETSPSVARNWLLERRPEEVDLALRTSLRSSLNVGLRANEELRFPTAGGYTAELVSYSVSDPDDRSQAALSKVQAAMTPATADQIEEWLVALQVATAGAKRSDVGARVAFQLYGAALSRFPADIAKAACEHFAMRSRWFPVLADLVEFCERLERPRRKMVEALARRQRSRKLEQAHG